MRNKICLTRVEMDKSEKITLFSIIILVGFAFGVIYHYILGDYLHYGGLFESFLYPARFAFCDFFSVLSHIKDFNPYKEVSLWTVYFPITYLFLFPFTLIKSKILAYLLYSSWFIIYTGVMNFKNFFCENLTKLQNFQNIFIITFLFYPFLYCLDKGNFDMYLFIMLGVWAYAFKDKKYLFSAVLLALMNAIKPFTLYFLLLYLKEKRYKDFFLSLILSGIFIFGGFKLLKGDYFTQIQILLYSVAEYKINYAYKISIFFGFSSSLFILLKSIMLAFTSNIKDIITFVKFYDYSCHIATIITLFFVWREKTYWKQLMLLICNFLLLPYITYDYKLMFLLIPIWFFINEERQAKFDLAYLLMLGFLLIPKNVIITLPNFYESTHYSLSLSAIVNPLIMVMISLLIIFEQFYKNKKTERNESNNG